MRYRYLGRSGLEVSTLCLGALMFGDRTDVADSGRIIADAAEHGVNFIDTADIYVRGESERVVGNAIRAQRDRWVLATKVANMVGGTFPAPPGTLASGLSRRWIMRACDHSLVRLGTDYIDIYYLHLDHWPTPLDETVGALGDLIRAGKIRYFGISNFLGWRIAEVMRQCDRLGVPQPVVCQPYYNMLNRMPEVEVLSACDFYGIGVAPYSALARGMLTGKYKTDAEAPADSRVARRDKRMMETEFRDGALEIVAKLDDYARSTGRTLQQLALAWMWANRIVTSIIAGPRTFEQWRAYLDALDTRWSAEDEAFVDALVPPGHPSTPGFTDPRYPLRGRRLAAA